MEALQEIIALIGRAIPEAKRERYFVDGAYRKTLTADKEQDIFIERTGGGATAFCHLAGGMAYTLPTEDYEVDYSIGKYRTKITFSDCVFTASAESGNPYLDRDDPWFIYGDEWLMRHLNSEKFLKNCDIEVFSKPKHLLSREEPYGDLFIKAGYDVYRYSFFVRGLKKPYYEIGVVRRADEMKHFALFVMKSETRRSEIMDGAVESLVRFAPFGVGKSYFSGGRAQPDPRWNRETREYFDYLQESHGTDWGVFSYSMPGEENSLHSGEAGYDEFYRKSRDMQTAIERAWGKRFDIYPTYTHIGRGKGADAYTPHHFPSEMARALAGGNGKDKKPVLQFTYQFTLNNNLVYEDETPMFDILRGKFDGQFRRLARDIKDYGKPVLFRLNNEMNTDWTSYCGMMTLLDPDVFCESWKRLYDIFTEEGVDNCIWIWNPIATTCPYCSWGEDLCYFPGKEYVQLIGGTSYEMNNYPKESAAKEVRSFREHYRKLYERNGANFPEWSVIISEFACGAGGDISGELKRNAHIQAEWVKGMFEELNARPRPEYARQLKGAVWFNCNDVFDGKVGNYLRFIEPDSERENETTEQFRKGFQNKKEISVREK